MTKTHIELVQASWKTLTSGGAGTAGSLLYQQLIDIVPEVAENVSQQQVKQPSRKILALVSYIVRKLHKPTDIIHEVENFSRRHINYFVQDEQFIRAGRSLLDIIAGSLGEKWNLDIEQAWLNCYVSLAETIMNAIETYDREPVYYC